MPPENPTPSGATPEPTPPATGDPAGSTPPPTPAPTIEPGDEPQDAAGLRALVEKLRRFERDAEPQLKELKRLKATEAERQRAAMTDAEKVKADAEAAAQRATAAEQRAAALEAKVRGYELRGTIEALVAPATLGEASSSRPTPCTASTRGWPPSCWRCRAGPPAWRSTRRPGCTPRPA